MSEYWTVHLKLEELDDIYEAIESQCLQSVSFDELEHWFRLYQTVAEHSYTSRKDKDFLKEFLTYFLQQKETGKAYNIIIDEFLEKRRKVL